MSREGTTPQRRSVAPGTVVPLNFDVGMLQRRFLRLVVDGDSCMEDVLTNDGKEHLQREVIRNIRAIIDDKETADLSAATLQAAFEERMRQSLIEVCTDSRYCTQSERMAQLIKAHGIHSTPFPTIPAPGLNPLEVIMPRIMKGCDDGGVCLASRLTEEGHKTLYWGTVGVIRTILDTPGLRSREAANGYFQEMLTENLTMIRENRVQAMFGRNPVLALSEEEAIRKNVTKRVAERILDAEGGGFVKALTRSGDVKSLTAELTPIITEALKVRNGRGNLTNYLNVLNPRHLETLKENLTTALLEYKGEHGSFVGAKIRITNARGRILQVSVTQQLALIVPEPEAPQTIPAAAPAPRQDMGTGAAAVPAAPSAEVMAPLQPEPKRGKKVTFAAGVLDRREREELNRNFPDI